MCTKNTISDRFKLRRDYSFLPENSDNLILKGDNVLVLKELCGTHKESIKCVYIDPPYNNGESYYYYTDRNKHNIWAENITKVLEHIKELLRNDGSLWISINDVELPYLRIIADTVFGYNNFLATVIWQQRTSRENRTAFSVNHEYILVYAKDANSFKEVRNLLPLPSDFISKRYKNPDNDPRGMWQSVTANVQDGHAVPSQYYTIISPSGVKHDPPKGRCWIYNKEKMDEEIKKNNIWFGLDGKGVPRVKKFLSERKVKGLNPETIWLSDIVGTTDSAKKHLKKLFPNNRIFETPKPEDLIKHIFDIATNENDIILDCYLGSGSTVTTAHKMNRKYIGIEIGEHIIDLVSERLKMVIGGEIGGISTKVAWKGGGDFALYEYK